MKRWARVLGTMAMIEISGLAITSCTTTYAEADVRAKETQAEAKARAEEARDRKIGEEGGANRKATEEEKEWADRQSDR